jgi:DNA-binding transcriptional ArsR family regulator
MPQRRAQPQTHRTGDLDQVFQALADATRRKVVERLVAGEASTSELAAPFDMALPSFIQHLSVLERAGLVTSTKRGRVRTYRLTRSALDVADGWLAEQRRMWEQRLDQLDDLLVTLQRDAGRGGTDRDRTHQPTTHQPTTHQPKEER